MDHFNTIQALSISHVTQQIFPKYLLCARSPVRSETYTDEKDREKHYPPDGHLLKTETRIQRNNLKIIIIFNNSCQEGC